MQKITISVVLALVAFASASAPAKKVDMTVAIDLLGSISNVDPKTIDKILNTENLTKLDKKDPKMAELADLLERISQMDWVEVYVFCVENQLTFDKQLNINGKKFDMKEIFELLARIAGINWTKFTSLFVPIKPTAPAPAANPSRRGQLDRAKLNKRVDRMSLIQLDKFVAASKQVDVVKLKERVDKLSLIELDKFVTNSKRQRK